MRMTRSELTATCRTYKALAKQRLLALDALDGSARLNIIYLFIVAEMKHIKWCLKTRSYTEDHKPWLVQTRYFI